MLALLSNAERCYCCYWFLVYRGISTVPKDILEVLCWPVYPPLSTLSLLVSIVLFVIFKGSPLWSHCPPWCGLPSRWLFRSPGIELVLPDQTVLLLHRGSWPYSKGLIVCLDPCRFTVVNLLHSGCPIVLPFKISSRVWSIVKVRLIGS